MSEAIVFPGQGVQRDGMDQFGDPAVWAEADTYTRDALGFSLLHIVRGNPPELQLDGETVQHPLGLLYLTQFAQVALSALAFAQVGERRKAGTLPERAYFAGQSLGELNALAAYAGVATLPDTLQIGWERGLVMRDLVPRDATGDTNYRLAALCPELFGVDDAALPSFVAEIAEQCGELLEVVNFNIPRRQFVAAGTKAALARLREVVFARARPYRGMPPYLEIEGIDIPFHSTVLRPGVPQFRAILDARLPFEIDSAPLDGRYVPNLTGELFTANDVPVRERLLTLLSAQLAAPVPWIKIQALLFSLADRYTEIGMPTAPTLTNLARHSAAALGATTEITMP